LEDFRLVPERSLEGWVSSRPRCATDRQVGSRRDRPPPPPARPL